MGRVRVGLLLEVIGQIVLIKHHVAGAQNLCKACVGMVQRVGKEILVGRHSHLVYSALYGVAVHCVTIIA